MILEELTTLWSLTLPEDGTISKLSNKSSSSIIVKPSSSISPPLETSTCNFTLKIISLQEGDKHILQNILDLSTYFSSTLQSITPSSIPARIGITSTTSIDRLLESALMKLIPGETALFRITVTSFPELCLLLQIDLISIIDPSTELHTLPALQLLEFSTLLKSHGVQLFTEKRIGDAFCKFSRALKYLILIDEQSNNLNLKLLQSKCELMTTLRNNLALCHFSSPSNNRNWYGIISLCSQVLVHEGSNVKALFRRGCALLEVDEYAKSRADFNLIKQLDPSNMLVDAKIVLLKKKEGQLNEEYASVCKKMFA